MACCWARCWYWAVNGVEAEGEPGNMPPGEGSEVPLLPNDCASWCWCWLSCCWNWSNSSGRGAEAPGNAPDIIDGENGRWPAGNAGPPGNAPGNMLYPYGIAPSPFALNMSGTGEL